MVNTYYRVKVSNTEDMPVGTRLLKEGGADLGHGLYRFLLVDRQMRYVYTFNVRPETPEEALEALIEGIW